MKILVIESDLKVYRISIYPGSCGHMLSCNDNRFEFPSKNWRISGFSKHYGYHAKDMTIKLDENINPDGIKDCWIWDHLGSYTRRWILRVENSYFDEASHEEIAKIVKARILK